MTATAKIFMHGRSQAVRLPKEFLEPMEKAPFDVEAWRAELDAAGARAFLPEGLPEDEPAAHDDEVSFD